MASPDPCDDNYDVLGHHVASGCSGGEEMNWDDVESPPLDSTTLPFCQQNYFFKISSLTSSEVGNASSEVSPVRCCNVFVDNRMTLERLKKHLEGIVRVPSDYFKVFRQYPNSEEEWSCLVETVADASLKDGER